MLWRLPAALLVVALLSAGRVHANQIQLNPTDADTIKPYQDNNYNSKSYIYSYYEGDATNKHTAFMKFDLSSIPDSATFDSMNLRMTSQLLVADASINSAHILHGANDNWSSTTTDTYPGTNEEVGGYKVVLSQFTNYNWDLDVGAFDYTADLTDNTLTLAINATHYVNWFALDGLNFAQYPVLTINYTPVPEPATLALAAMAVLGGVVAFRRRQP